MTRKQIKTITCALLHNGIDVDKLNATAKSELWAALKILMAARTDNSEAPK